MVYYIETGTGYQANLGNIFEEKFPAKSNLDHVTFPLSGSNEAFTYDYNGVARVITLRGRKTFDTKEDMWNWISTIDQIQNGNQDVTNFHSDEWANSTGGNYTDGIFSVKVDSFDAKVIEGTPLMVEYTLVMFEGT